MWTGKSMEEKKKKQDINTDNGNLMFSSQREY